MYDVHHPHLVMSMQSIEPSLISYLWELPLLPSADVKYEWSPTSPLSQSVIPQRGSGIHLIKGAKSKKRAAASAPPPIHLAGWLAPSKAT